MCVITAGFGLGDTFLNENYHRDGLTPGNDEILKIYTKKKIKANFNCGSDPSKAAGVEDTLLYVLGPLHILFLYFDT